MLFPRVNLLMTAVCDRQTDLVAPLLPTFDETLLALKPNPSPKMVTLQDPEVAGKKLLTILIAELSK
jgi:hypothetical protein